MLRAILGGILRRRGQASATIGDTLDKALQAYRVGELVVAQGIATRLVSRDPSVDEAWNLLGVIAMSHGNHASAADSFDRAAILAPDNAAYAANGGEAWRQRGSPEQAVKRCQRATRVDFGYAPAHYNLALALHAGGRIPEARAAYQQALLADPSLRAAHSGLLFLLCHDPDASGEEILAEHRRWNLRHVAGIPLQPPRPARGAQRPDQLRVGYVSADLCQHAVAWFLEPILARHDRDRFQVHCYSSGTRSDHVTARLRSYPLTWHDISGHSNEQAAAAIAADAIDVLIDLSGHTRGNRLPLFARRPAPVQLTYLGYLNTTGLDAMDFRITDGVADPVGVSDVLHRERLLRMPHAQWCYRPPDQAPPVGGLPSANSGQITFGSTHSMAKLNQGVLALWARVLTSAPNARLLIAGVPEDGTRAHLFEPFAAANISADRVQFVGRVGFAEYWALYLDIDIALDAFPHGGATTTCEALWMGVPVVTMAGQYAAARSGASLLQAVGLNELVAADADSFVRIARELSEDRSRLATLRQTLRSRMLASPLRDESAFVRAFEALLDTAWRERVPAGVNQSSASPAGS